ncbi:MAG: hypothetical protein WBR26_20010 [Candidatus Acidiferrum sp.]
MKETPQRGNEAKLKYQPPQVVRVSLRPDEAVLGHCKVPGVAGAVSAGCKAVIPCRTFGS